MNRFFFIICCLFLTNTSFSLNEKEHSFLEQHKITEAEEQVVNEIFGNLDQKLYDLLDGKTLYDEQDVFVKLFEQANFTVHNIRSKQYKQEGSDGFPARVILTHEKLPDYFIKIGFDRKNNRKNISRIMLADVMNGLIDDPKNNITMMEKIEKKICRRPHSISDKVIDLNYIVLSPKIDGKPLENSQGFNLMFDVTDEKDFKKVQDLIFVSYQLQLGDPAAENMLETKDGKLIFIDTEALQNIFIKALSNKFLNERK